MRTRNYNRKFRSTRRNRTKVLRRYLKHVTSRAALRFELMAEGVL
jgi:hypothetical protein